MPSPPAIHPLRPHLLERIAEADGDHERGRACPTAGDHTLCQRLQPRQQA